jgi:hypothetical protein
MSEFAFCGKIRKRKFSLPSILRFSISRSLSSTDNAPLGVKTRCLCFGVFIDNLIELLNAFFEMTVVGAEGDRIGGRGLRFKGHA